MKLQLFKESLHPGDPFRYGPQRLRQLRLFWTVAHRNLEPKRRNGQTETLEFRIKKVTRACNTTQSAAEFSCSSFRSEWFLFIEKITKQFLAHFQYISSYFILTYLINWWRKHFFWYYIYYHISSFHSLISLTLLNSLLFFF